MSDRNPTAGTIAVDAMGSDLGPAEMVAAVKNVIDSLPGQESITMVGDRAVLDSLVAAAGLSGHPRLTVTHASEVITMEDKPLQAIKRKKDSSMMRAIDLVKTGEALAVVSCGNTGSLMAGATLKLHTIQGIDRPALAALAPHRTGHFVLIDAGANPDATPEHLVHNAILGSQYCRVVLGVARPRVGLLTIGTEEGKGNVLVTETHELLKKVGGIVNYYGPIEGFQVFDNHVDVVVCDGFTGNIVLKTCESLFAMLMSFLKQELTKTPVRKLGAYLSKGAFREIRRQVSPERYGGAPLIGLNGYVLKAHGSSNQRHVASAIHAAGELIKMDMNQLIESDVARVNDLLRQPVA